MLSNGLLLPFKNFSYLLCVWNPLIPASIEKNTVIINILNVTDETPIPIAVKFKGKTIRGTRAKLIPILKANISKKSNCLAGNNIFNIEKPGRNNTNIKPIVYLT